MHMTSQEDAVKMAVQLPEFIISADDSFDAEDFMRHVLTDSSFYQAFIHLKYVPHDFTSTLVVKNKGEKERKIGAQGDTDARGPKTSGPHLGGEDQWARIQTEWGAQIPDR
ncbi:MAG: hypothetical protein HKN79_02765 [Flavobacteriales bacterium]|nr:hypothetical protein [Flavobacteriales bacterium]